MIIDSHAHLLPGDINEQEEILLKSMENHGIGFSIISSCEASERETEPNFPQIEALKHGIYLVKRNPTKLGCLFWVRPNSETLDEDTLKFLDENAEFILGMKVHPCCSKLAIDDPKFVPYLELAKRKKWPVLVHTAIDEESKIEHLINVAKKYKSVNFIAAHLELLTDNLHCIDALVGIKNIYADTAWVNENSCKLAIEKLGKNKVLFGTDNPVDGLLTLDNEMYAPYLKKTIDIDEESYELLMRRNASKIYGLKF